MGILRSTSPSTLNRTLRQINLGWSFFALNHAGTRSGRLHPITALWLYSGTTLNGHPSTADTHDITDNSESPDCPSVHFNT